jgi:hypothetical protein
VSELVEFSESQRVASRYQSGTILTAIETTEHPHRIEGSDGDLDLVEGSLTEDGEPR